MRTVGIDGEPWFVAADVCAALSIANSRDAATRLDEDKKGVATIDTLGGRQELGTVNESRLYSLILGSRKPEAKRFKKWVTSEVLPAIRKTGSDNGPVIDPMKVLTDSTLTTDSRRAVKHFKKRHRDVQRVFDKLDCSAEYNQRNFASVGERDAKGELSRMGLMTKDEFALA